MDPELCTAIYTVLVVQQMLILEPACVEGGTEYVDMWTRNRITYVVVAGGGGLGGWAERVEPLKQGCGKTHTFAPVYSTARRARAPRPYHKNSYLRPVCTQHLVPVANCRAVEATHSCE